MRRITTGLTLTSLALIIASCGTAPTTDAPLVSFNLAAHGGAIQALGLTSDAPPMHFDVRVRDSANKLVAFNGTTFDPTGTGTTVLTLDSANAFRKTLLLPAGTYTFENAAKDDATGNTLLAYGPAAENSATIAGDNAVVRLKFHAVFDKASSKLDFSTNIAKLFTNSTFNLSLSPKTSPVNGVSASVPTTDIGNVTYALGTATDGVLNNSGSKIGINVTARGTDTDSTLNVTASFNAWIRNAGTDTASYGPTSVEFTKAIETNAMVVDKTAPVVTMNPVTAYQDSPATLSGTATDDVQVTELRVYADGKMVASNVGSDGVTAITTGAGGSWTTTWTPAATGSQDLTLVVSDNSGNEARATQTANVSLRDYDIVLNGDSSSYTSYTIPANGDLWVKINATTTADNHMDIYFNSGSTTGTTATYGASKANQMPITNYGNMYEANTGIIAGAFYIHLTNLTAQPISGDLYNSHY